MSSSKHFNDLSKKITFSLFFLIIYIFFISLGICRKFACHEREYFEGWRKDEKIKFSLMQFIFHWSIHCKSVIFWIQFLFSTTRKYLRDACQINYCLYEIIAFVENISTRWFFVEMWWATKKMDEEAKLRYWVFINRRRSFISKILKKIMLRTRRGYLRKQHLIQ